MRFLLDENISPQVSLILKNKSVDAVSVHEIGLQGSSDIEVMEVASSQGRCIVTNDRDDFIEISNSYFAENRQHAGVLILSRSLGKKHAVIADALTIYAHDHQDEIYEFLLDFVGSSTWT